MVKNIAGNFVTFGNAILRFQVRFSNRHEIMLFKNYCDEYVSESSVFRNTACMMSIRLVSTGWKLFRALLKAPKV